MIGIDLGNHQRHVWLHTERRGVAHHSTSRLGELWLQLACDPGVECSKDDPRRSFGPCWRNWHFTHMVGDWRLQPPTHGVSIRLPGRAVRGGQPRYFKPGVVFQQLNEALTDNTSSAENSDGYFLLRHCL